MRRRSSAICAFPAGNGSGFYLAAAGKTFLVTAAHVLEEGVRLSPAGSGFTATSYSCDPGEPVPNVFQIDLPELQSRGLVKIDEASPCGTPSLQHSLST